MAGNLIVTYMATTRNPRRQRNVDIHITLDDKRVHTSVE